MNIKGVLFTLKALDSDDIPPTLLNKGHLWGQTHIALCLRTAPSGTCSLVLCVTHTLRVEAGSFLIRDLASLYVYSFWGD